jgi:hypothetical protein
VIYVDALRHNGWILRGHKVKNCHLFTDDVSLEELHLFAARLGLRFSWFQNASSCPHYDLTATRRARAVRLGAIELDRRQAVAIWRERRELVRS